MTALSTEIDQGLKQMAVCVVQMAAGNECDSNQAL